MTKNSDENINSTSVDKELTTSSKDLTTSNKDLTISNKDLTASNKELIASNKELLTSNKELVDNKIDANSSVKEVSSSAKEVSDSDKKSSADNNKIITSDKDVNTVKKKSIKDLLTFSNILIFHWSVYWIMNGLDKFLNRTNLGQFFWHGKDRSDQFEGYFGKTKLPLSAVDNVLFCTGLIELIVGVPLIILLIYSIKNKVISRSSYEMAFMLSAAIFVGFSFFDIIFGDRGELLEHGTFLVGVMLSYNIVKDDFKERGLLS